MDVVVVDVDVICVDFVVVGCDDVNVVLMCMWVLTLMWC